MKFWWDTKCRETHATNMAQNTRELGVVFGMRKENFGFFQKGVVDLV